MLLEPGMETREECFDLAPAALDERVVHATLGYAASLRRVLGIPVALGDDDLVEDVGKRPRGAHAGDPAADDQGSPPRASRRHRFGAVASVNTRTASTPAGTPA